MVPVVVLYDEDRDEVVVCLPEGEEPDVELTRIPIDQITERDRARVRRRARTRRQ